MRTILLAAGYGTRLRPLTNKIPKCLAPIKGKPLLEIWLECLTRANMGPFLVNTHYLADQVETFVNTGRYRDQVSLVHEPELLGTAGTLIKNLDYFQGEDGLLIHADNYCLADFSSFLRAHQRRPRECVMTMMTFRTNDPQSCGIVGLDERGVVTEFHEKVTAPPGNLASGAVYILTSELMEILKKDMHGVSDFSNQVLQRFIGKIYSYETTDLFLDIGTPETYAAANR